MQRAEAGRPSFDFIHRHYAGLCTIYTLISTFRLVLDIYPASSQAVKPSETLGDVCLVYCLCHTAFDAASSHSPALSAIR